MNIKVTEKIIKDMCGTASFKKGDSFHRALKVLFEEFQSDFCIAVVIGNEDFKVRIEGDEAGRILAQCSCPKLASYQKDCQHVAAVLLAISMHQRQGTRPTSVSVDQTKVTTDHALTEGLLTLFENQPKATSKQQSYFENREVLDVEFICKLIKVSADQLMLGIEMKLGSIFVENIRDFLQKVEEAKPSSLSMAYKYDPSLHCFDKDTDEVIGQLIIISKDDKLNIDEPDALCNDIRSSQTLVVPPSSCDAFLAILARAPNVTLNDGLNEYLSVQVVNERHFLQFDLIEGSPSGYRLNINGHKQISILNDYNYVCTDGVFVRMKSDDIKRLSHLMQMLAASNTDQIPIPKEQLPFFLEKIEPGLRKFGDVQISAVNTSGLVKTPLKAKLYLDRVKNRLLAALEFHYDQIVINPSDSEELKSKAVLNRDYEKEDYLLELIEESGFTKTDAGFYLHNEKLEYEFLYYIIPHLEKQVQIYATTSVKLRIFKANKPPQIRIKLKKARVNWLEFKFEMDGIPEKQIREILLALEEKRKYYRLPNGSFLPLETNEFRDVSRFMAAVPNQHLELEKGLNMPIVRGLQLLDASHESQLFSLEKSFKQFIDALKDPDRLNFTVPKSLDTILRNYQKQGFQWMKTIANYGFGGILADDMGLGKTIQSIAFIVSVMQDIREKKTPILIVCPSSLTYNWLSELKKFAPEVKVMIIDRDKKERMKRLKNCSSYDVVITSYPLVRMDISSYEKQIFHTAFFDEAQAFKNPITQTARAVKRIRAEHRFALTGTPVENSLVELWSIFHVVFPELFLGLKEYSNLTNEAIARRISLFLLRRVKEDVLAELPEKIETLETVELLSEQKKLYAAYLAKLKHETLKHLDKETLNKNRIKILAGLTRLRQICCHPGLFIDDYKGSSAKFEQLIEILEEAQLSGRRVLIFSQFTKMLSLIGKKLTQQGKSFFYLDGHTPALERLETCQRFNRGERDLFLISLKAGGTGLNLTGADTVILYDLWWNPAVEEQAADRAHRIGQKNVVQVIKLVARGTIEEKINQLQEKKKDLIEEIIDPSENKLNALTEDDIRELFAESL